MSFQVVYVPIGVGTYHMESAGEQFEKSVKMLKGLTDSCVCPEGVLLNLDDLKKYLDSTNPSLIILQNVTFANAAYASEVLRRFSCPILLWTLREPVIDGGRLRLNSLTGAFSAANAICAFRKDGQFEYIFGTPEESEVIEKVKNTIAAAKMLTEIKRLKIAAIGHTPEGFGFGRALDAEIMSVFGCTLISVEARELMEKAKNFSDEDCVSWLDKAKSIFVGLEKTPEKNVKDFARLYRAYDEFIKDNGVKAIASRCWPDFFTSFGTPVCSVLSLLNSEGTVSACEADTYGALSMFICSQLTKSACFFGDPVSLDEKESTITFWHCGMAACSLARKDTGAEVGVHPNRKIGPTMEFGCKPSDNAVIFRIGRKPDGKFRMFIAEGSIPDKQKQFCGTSIVVKTNNPSKEIVTSAIKAGFEPHYVVAYDNVSEVLEILGHMLGIEVCRF